MGDDQARLVALVTDGSGFTYVTPGRPQPPMSVESCSVTPATAWNLARHVSSRAMSALLAWSIRKVTCWSAYGELRSDGSGWALTAGTLAQVDRTVSRCESGVPVRKLTTAWRCPSAASN